MMDPVGTEDDPEREAVPGSLSSIAARFPAGVCVLAFTHAGRPSVVIALTFVMVSEHPARVAVVLSDAATARILADSTGFSVNVLSARHLRTYRSLARDAPHALNGITEWRLSATGVPVLTGVAAWMEAEVDHVTEVADGCVVVVATVRSRGDSSAAPLVVVDGGHGELLTSSLAAQGHDIGAHLALIDLVRTEMEALAADLACRVVAQALVKEQHVFLASAGHLVDDTAPAMPVGKRTPAVPPSGAIFAAWADDEAVERWLRTLDRAADPDAARADARQRLKGIRARGFSVSLHQDSHTRLMQQAKRGQLPARHEELDDDQFDLMTTMAADPVVFGPADVGRVDWLALPVFGPDGEVALALGIEGLERPRDWAEFEDRLARLEEASSRATAAIGGHLPLVATREDE